MKVCNEKSKCEIDNTPWHITQLREIRYIRPIPEELGEYAQVVSAVECKYGHREQLITLSGYYSNGSWYRLADIPLTRENIQADIDAHEAFFARFGL